MGISGAEEDYDAVLSTVPLMTAQLHVPRRRILLVTGGPRRRISLSASPSIVTIGELVTALSQLSSKGYPE
jgi:hypothetical protein